MSKKNTSFQELMEPWSTLVGCGKDLKLEDGDLRFFYFEGGNHDQKNLILVHGLGDEADTWRHVFHPLAEQFHTIALDLPGFGRSDKPDVDYTPDFFDKSIIGLMDHLSITSAILMGSSLGGILAHQLALTYPNRVKGLVLVGGALLQPEPMQDLSLRLMRLPWVGEWLYTRLRNDPDAAFNSLKSVYHHLEDLPEADQSFLFTRVNQRVWDDGQRRAYFSTLRKLASWIKHIQGDLPAQLRNLDIPTLVIRGEFDVLFPQSNAKAITDVQPNATKATILNSGHLPQQEDPEGFLQVVKPWLHDHV